MSPVKRHGAGLPGRESESFVARKKGIASASPEISGLVASLNIISVQSVLRRPELRRRKVNLCHFLKVRKFRGHKSC